MTVDNSPVMYNIFYFWCKTGRLNNLLHLVFGYKCVCVLVKVSIKQECHMPPI